jgi:hypothetical protein
MLTKITLFFLSREYSRGGSHCRFYFIEKQQQQQLLLYREVKELHKGKTKERRPEQGQRKQTQPKKSCSFGIAKSRSLKPSLVKEILSPRIKGGAATIEITLFGDRSFIVSIKPYVLQKKTSGN